MLETSTGLLKAARDCSNDAAWGRLVSLYEPLLQGWLRRQGVQHADADDLVEETLAAVALELPTFQHSGQTGAFRSWLRGILVNRLLNFRRAQRVRSICPADSDLLHRLADVLADPESDLARKWDDDHDRYVATPPPSAQLAVESGSSESKLLDLLKLIKELCDEGVLKPAESKRMRGAVFQNKIGKFLAKKLSASLVGDDLSLLGDDGFLDEDMDEDEDEAEDADDDDGDDDDSDDDDSDDDGDDE